MDRTCLIQAVRLSTPEGGQYFSSTGEFCPRKAFVDSSMCADRGGKNVTASIGKLYARGVTRIAVRREEG
jgi:hypothetical protein